MTLLSTAAVTVRNPVVVAAGAGGALTVGTVSVSTPAFSGAFTLNGDLTVYSLSTNAAGMALTGAVSGVGGIIKTGSGAARRSNFNNTYQGGTVVSEGTLIASGNNALAVDNVTINASALLMLNATMTDAISDAATLSLISSGVTAGKLNLLGAANAIQETVAILSLGGVNQPLGTYGSSTSGATFMSGTYFPGAES